MKTGIKDKRFKDLMLAKMGYSTDACRCCTHFEVAEDRKDPARCTIGLYWVEVVNDGTGHCNHFEQPKKENCAERKGFGSGR